jgi:hypothetical protein
LHGDELRTITNWPKARDHMKVPATVTAFFVSEAAQAVAKGDGESIAAKIQCGRFLAASRSPAHAPPMDAASLSLTRAADPGLSGSPEPPAHGQVNPARFQSL